MYAAHAEQKRKESSQIVLEDCMSILQSAKSDNDKFMAVVEIAECVHSNSFTDADRVKILQAMGCDFLARLIRTTSVPSGCPGDLYKSMALSVLSVVSVEPSMAVLPEMKEILPEVNGVISSSMNERKSDDKSRDSLQIQMCEDCIDFISHFAQHEKGIDLLTQGGTVPLLLDLVESPVCQKKVSVLSSLSSVVKSRGDGVFLGKSEKFHSIMSLAVDSLVQTNDLREKSSYAKIITSLLSGMSLMEADESVAWVVKITQCVKKLMVLKLNPEQSEILLLLACALVSAVGAGVLRADVTGDSTLLRTVVARLSVETYMLLDGISLENAMERYPTMDKVYKLICDVVQFVAENDEDSADTDSIIAVYRKLVDISQTLMEFLFSVANQEVELPRNHVVVLLSVRTLAAMLTEITEDPTPQLLELLPFFNLLCQNVDYSDDVKMEVKNATQAALANIKMMGMNVINEVLEEVEEEEEEERDGGKEEAEKTRAEAMVSSGEKKSSSRTASEKKSKCENSGDASHSGGSAFDSLDVKDGFKQLSLSHSSEKQENSESVNVKPTTDHSHHLLNGDVECDVNDDPGHNSGDGSQKETSGQRKKKRSQQVVNVELDAECLEKFNVYRETLRAAKLKPALLNQRQLSFIGKAKKKRGSEENSEVSPHWHPNADDVLGFLLPTYAFLLEHEEVLQIMVKCDAFQTVVNFIEKSLSQFLESKSTVFPESTTRNALGVLEQVYSNAPATAARLDCFQNLFEISVLSVPNLVGLSHPPALVCLKLIEVTLVAYRLQMRGQKRNSSLSRLKHSQSRFFRAVVEYLASFYAIRQSRRQQALVLQIVRESRDMWPLIEDAWCGTVAGLCTLIRDVEDLQDAFVKSLMIPEFLTFLAESDGDADLHSYPEGIQRLMESLLSLVESAAEGSDILCEMLLHHHGRKVASKFGLQKLARCLQSKVSAGSKPT
ncbi:uncharacterized protein LOC101853229 [Aplysia californica]|uniref:Uncharacterized protein LOC101853229 n=1 Tax=Aplysia californica TaxID=6500 RepID=A0ABM0JK44_APLCA|nr:uncharacterized protein LOC101853229 [Aplysia californica]